ncbi:hypothetical protein J2Z43_001225 [Clostridioides mangenotii]|uniref:Uncharacterized protein n=1 Tax=Metaclostridioides mangenotii TaxID=1540 RepID=A0ABS4EA63_9FIRM|nr:hypothetical protein [Clostridioides mangenotii]
MATEESDFDVVVKLDDLRIDDFSSYRKIVSTMPESGARRLLTWKIIKLK